LWSDRVPRLVVIALAAGKDIMNKKKFAKAKSFKKLSLSPVSLCDVVGAAGSASDPNGYSGDSPVDDLPGVGSLIPSN
jgi:hypothetical protein